MIAMKPAVQVACPNCQNVLRVPPDLGDASVKCKHCGFILQLKKKATPPPPPPAGRAAAPVFPISSHIGSNGTTAPVASAARTLPASALPLGLEELPEYVPPAVQQFSPSNRVPTPIVAPLPLDDGHPASPSDYNPAFETAGQRYTGRGSYKGPRNSGMGKWIALGVILLIGTAAMAIVMFKRDWFGDKPGAKSGNTEQEQVNNTNDGGNNPGTGANTKQNPVIKVDIGKKPPPAIAAGPMPRRMLAISITNYPYVNALNYGDSKVDREADRKDFYKAIDRLATGWKIPKDQTYFLTDGPVENNKVDSKHIPLKMVVEGTIERFLETSRAQDRIVLVFAGHAMEKDGEAYLVPLEGEFEEIPTLIPLKPIYEKLAKCKAQEKLVIFDVCRFDPGRGVERPIFGTMTEGLEKALHDCPPDTAVVTSCSAGQYSYEYDYWQAEVPGLYRTYHSGSVFFSLFFTADSKKSLLSKLTPPDGPLPIHFLLEYLQELVPAAVKDIEKKEQKVKYTSKLRTEWLAYNKDEPLAPKFEYPAPPPSAKREEVLAMFKETNLPPVKAALKKDEKETKLADNFPFTEAALKDYVNDGPTFEDIQKAPEKFEKEFPLRVATVEALIEMRKLVEEKSKDDLPEEIRAPITDQFKARITNNFQRLITTRQGILEEQKEKLETVAKKREMEKSKRWQANYDYAMAQTKIRLAYIFEYNLALGKVKLEQLPERDEKVHRGWKLSSSEKMMSPKEIRDMAEEGKTLLTEMMKAHPNTPWAVLGKSQRFMTIGLSWQPSSFGFEPTP